MRERRWSLRIEEDDNFHVKLPRAALGGLKKAPVEDLLRRIGYDYAKLEAENSRLWRMLEETVREQTNSPLAGADRSPVDEAGVAPDERNVTPDGSTSVVSLEQENGKGAVQHSPDPQRAGQLAEPAPRKERDDLASAVLTMAQQAARELRESTRDECELIIRRTRSRARKLELEFEHTRAVTSAEVEELRALEHEMREHMRSSLQALLRTVLDESSDEMPVLDWSDESSFVLDGKNEQTPRRKKNKKSKS